MTPEQKRIRDLTEQNEVLKERISILSKSLSDSPSPLISLGLTIKEAQLVACVAKTGFASRDKMMAAMYFDAREEPNMKVLDIFLMRARRKLSKFGINIETVFGQGLRMDEASLAKLREISGGAA